LLCLIFTSRGFRLGTRPRRRFTDAPEFVQKVFCRHFGIFFWGTRLASASKVVAILRDCACRVVGVAVGVTGMDLTWDDKIPTTSVRL
jgi:hypothetical protein